MSKKVPTIDEIIDILRKVREVNVKERIKCGVMLNNYLENMKQIIHEAVQAGYVDEYSDKEYGDLEFDLYCKLVLALPEPHTVRKVHNEITEKIIL